VRTPMKEHGEFFLATNDQVPPNAFVLNVSDIEINTNDTVKIEHLHPILVTCDMDDGDAFVAIGVIRRENIKGRDCLMMINPEATVKM
jgi:hypothetical protein